MPNPPGTDPTAEVIATDRPGTEAPTVRPMPWYMIVLVRALRAGLSASAGLFTADAFGVVPIPDKSRLVYALTAGASAAAWSVMQNTIELLTKLDQSHPGMRA